jgi:hypothetical protein
LAKGLGIVLEKTSEAFTPVIAEQATSSSILGPVKAGAVRGIYQIARGYRARREVITLELTMALDEPNARDTIDIVGEPPLHFQGELPGDSCTIATVLSAISVVVTMPAGLRTVLDVPLEQPEEPSQTREPALVARSRTQTELPTPAAAAAKSAKSKKAAKKKAPAEAAPAPSTGNGVTAKKSANGAQKAAAKPAKNAAKTAPKKAAKKKAKKGKARARA